MLHCLDGFFVETHAERPLHVDIARPAISIYDDPEQNRSLELCLAGLFGILRIWIVNRARCGNPSAHPIRATAEATAMSGAKTSAYS